MVPYRLDSRQAAHANARTAVLLNQHAAQFKEFLEKALADPELATVAQPGQDFEADSFRCFALQTVYGTVLIDTSYGFVNSRFVSIVTFSWLRKLGEGDLQKSVALTVYLNQHGAMTIESDGSFQWAFGRDEAQDKELAWRVLGHLFMGIEAQLSRLTTSF